MDNQENWTLALTAASVAEAEGFTETAKAFAEIAAMEMDVTALFDAPCNLDDISALETVAPGPEPIFRSVRLR
ncbi:hypothetical protein NX862_04665 [Rhodobacter sp. KR11]|uniref:hypothetical protein n=1 Tax=Rhodobacter sp. KR11 TaxID=2974588 RepID=UPI002221570E|nr:hypothetical protein [Rhodobacter sp. KR11]MCW1918037.1 hypothetical protein [Rhodobacter sp. KR11]